MNDLNIIVKLINELPNIDLEKIDYAELFREEYDKFTDLDSLLNIIKEDIEFLEETAKEIIVNTQNDLFSYKLKDFEWKNEIEETENGLKYLSLYLILNSFDKGRIFLPVHIFKDLDDNYIYFEATSRDDNFETVKILTRGTFFTKIKNYINNKFRAI
jgi:hypothetical protein